MRTSALHIGMFLTGVLVLVALVVLALGGGGEGGFALAAPLAQQVDWWTLDAGGGRSSGATYSVTGTTGQPDANPSGALSGGSYSVQGGFWPGVRAETAETTYGLYLPMVKR